jgi:hypothetical protein
MHGATWNEDGSWFVVKDDLDRLLLVTTADPSATRLLVDGRLAGGTSTGPSTDVRNHLV